MNIVLVRQGTKYPPRYVKMLREMLKEHAYGARVWTLTDQADTPGDFVQLKHGLPGWWAKIEMFAPENRWLRPFLFLDLDTYVLGDIGDIIAWKPERLAVLSDFYTPEHQQSAMMVVPDYHDGIWGKFHRGVMDRHRDGGDQEFIEACVPNALRLQEVFDGLTSYKVHCKEGPVGRVVAFHGQPKPDSCEAPWVRDIWSRHE